jgi:redox-regulated HSP33 family molecular chaperone
MLIVSGPISSVFVLNCRGIRSKKSFYYQCVCEFEVVGSALLLFGDEGALESIITAESLETTEEFR